MTTVRKYPAVWAGGAGWFTPQNSVGVDDGLCATNGGTIVRDDTVAVSSFGFAIPAGSAINSYKIGAHARLYNAVNLSGQCYMIVAWNRLGLSDRVDADTGGYLCADSTDSESVGGNAINVADLNGENFSAVIHARGTVDNGWVWRCSVDAVWVEVNYTAPPSVGSAGGNSVIAVLAGIQGYVHRRRKRRFIATLK